MKKAVILELECLKKANIGKQSLEPVGISKHCLRCYYKLVPIGYNYFHFIEKENFWDYIAIAYQESEEEEGVETDSLNTNF